MTQRLNLTHCTNASFSQCTQGDVIEELKKYLENLKNRFFIISRHDVLGREGGFFEKYVTMTYFS